jgi:hypothetical protein
VAQESLRATREDCSHPTLELAKGTPTHQKNPAMNGLQPPSGYAVINRVITEPKFPKLAPSDHPVLTARERPGGNGLLVTLPGYRREK